MLPRSCSSTMRLSDAGDLSGCLALSPVRLSTRHVLDRQRKHQTAGLICNHELHPSDGWSFGHDLAGAAQRFCQNSMQVGKLGSLFILDETRRVTHMKAIEAQRRSPSGVLIGSATPALRDTAGAEGSTQYRLPPLISIRGAYGQRWLPLRDPARARTCKVRDV